MKCRIMESVFMADEYQEMAFGHPMGECLCRSIYDASHHPLQPTLPHLLRTLCRRYRDIFVLCHVHRRNGLHQQQGNNA